MTDEERIDWLCRLRTDLNNGIIYTPWNKEFTEALTEVLEPQPITWVVGKDNCQVAVRNMPIDKMQKICAIIGEEEQQPCEDAISREDTLNKINALIAEYIPLMPIGWTLPLNIAKTINEMPSVTPQPKTGHWEDCSNGWMCSNCERDVSYESDFCPHCGADMRGEEK